MKNAFKKNHFKIFYPKKLSDNFKLCGGCRVSLGLSFRQGTCQTLLPPWLKLHASSLYICWVGNFKVLHGYWDNYSLGAGRCPLGTVLVPVYMVLPWRQWGGWPYCLHWGCPVGCGVVCWLWGSQCACQDRSWPRPWTHSQCPRSLARFWGDARPLVEIVVAIVIRFSMTCGTARWKNLKQLRFPLLFWCSDGTGEGKIVDYWAWWRRLL